MHPTAAETLQAPVLKRLVGVRDARDFLDQYVLGDRILVARGPASRFGLSSRSARLRDALAMIVGSRGELTALWGGRRGGPAGTAVACRAPQALDHFAAGATIRIPNVDRDMPSVARLLRHLEYELGYPPNAGRAIAFASPRGAAFFPHADPGPFFILQVTGIKRWSLTRAPVLPNLLHSFVIGEPPVPSLARYSARLPRAMPARTRSIRLGAGTCLFVPAGILHRTNTLSDSLSLSFDFPNRPVSRCLAEFVEQALVRDATWRSPAHELLLGGDAEASLLRRLTRSSALRTLARLLGDEERLSAVLRQARPPRCNVLLRVRQRARISWSADGGELILSHRRAAVRVNQRARRTVELILARADWFRESDVVAKSPLDPGVITALVQRLLSMGILVARREDA